MADAKPPLLLAGRPNAVVHRSAPQGFGVKLAGEFLECLGNIGRRRLRLVVGQQSQQFNRRLPAVKRLDHRLHGRVNAVVGKRVAPGFEKMRLRNVPCAQPRGLVAIEAQVDAQVNRAATPWQNRDRPGRCRPDFHRPAGASSHRAGLSRRPRIRSSAAAMAFYAAPHPWRKTSHPACRNAR